MNNFAISSGGIGEALKRSASALYSANNTLDESIALITSANEVVQNPETVGQAYKTIALRIRGAKSELEDAGLETDGLIESTSKLREEVLALSGVDIMEADGKTFKSTYDILNEISKVYDDLSDISQANLLEIFAGKRQSNILAATLSNFDTAREALDTSMNSAGSAMREHEKWQESLEAQINKLKASWQGLSQAFLKSDFLKSVLNTVIGLVDGLTKLIDALGTLGTIGFGTSIFSMFKNKGLFTGILGDLGAFVSLMPDAIKSSGTFGEKLKNLGSIAGQTGSSITSRFTGSLSGMIGGIGIAIAAISLIINAYKNYREEISKARQETIRESDEFLDSASSFERAYIKYSGKTNLTVDEENELKSAINGTSDALGDKSSALQSVISSSNDYVASLEQIANAELQAAESAAKAKRDAAKLELTESLGKGTLFGGMGSVTIDIPDDKDDEAVKAAKEIFGDYVKTTHGRKKTYSIHLNDDDNLESIMDYYYKAIEYRDRLSEMGLTDNEGFEEAQKAIDKMSELIAQYTDGVYEAAKAQYKLANGIPKTTEEYIAMRRAILTNDDIASMPLSQRVALANELESEYKQMFDLSSVEVQARKFIGLIKGYGDGTKDGTNEIGTVETFLNVRTALNNNECSVGEYFSQLEKIDNMAMDWSEEERELFNTSFGLGLDADAVMQQYKEMYQYLSRFYDSDELTSTITDIEEFLNGLTAYELAAVVDIRTEIDWKNANAKDIRKQIEEQVKINEALNFTISIDVESEGVEMLNAALSESISATGLSSESIAALKSRYADLESEGYNLSAMFEETSNGIHLNRNAVKELEEAYASNKLSETNDKLETLKDEYDGLTKEINNCTDASERADLYRERKAIIDKINDLATLAAQYEGLTSAYNDWLVAEEAGQERDMYENIIEGFETIDDELSRGWLDDGAIEFLELLTGRTDLAGKSGKELKQIYDNLDKTIKNTGYSIRDFFTVDEDGNSTNTGVYNFLDAVGQLEEEKFGGKDIVKRDKNGNIIGFDFELAGGDEVIAEALGVSEELVQIMVRASDDAGFVVNIEGAYTQLADLKTEAETARDALISLKKDGLDKLKDVDVDFDLNAEGNDLIAEQKKALELLDKFRNKDGTINLDASGAKEALEIAEYLTIALDDATEPRYMQVDVSTVEKDLQKPIEKMQEFERLAKEKHLLTLTGDKKGLEEVEAKMSEIAQYLDSITDEETQVKLGIKGLSKEEIEEKLEKGEIELNAELNVDVQMSDDLRDMRLMMMNQLGLVSDNEVKLKIGYDIDDSVVEELTEEEKEVVVKYIADHEEIEDWSPEAKNAFVKYLVDGGDPEKFDPDDKDSWVVYDTDTSKPDGYDPNDPTATVTYEKDSSKVDGYDPPDLFRTVWYTIKEVFSNIASGGKTKANQRTGADPAGNDGNHRGGRVNGTANVDGTTGRAFARGNWRTKKTETALTGELGQEIVVTPNNQWYTVGGSGAEFATIPKGSIVFNHKQTEQLFKYGKVTSGGGRAKALVNGTAFSSGSGGGLNIKDKIKEDLAEKKKKQSAKSRNVTSTKSSSSSNSSTKTSGSSSSSGGVGKASGSAVGSSNDKFDFIEIAISRIERAIDNLDKRVNNVYDSWSSRNNALGVELSNITREINLQQKAYDAYMAEADKVGLDKNLAQKVREGSIDIDSLSENDAKKVKEYQQWYEKAIACKDAIVNLKETEASLYEQRFENIQTQYDAILQGYEHTESMLNEYISQAEAKGHIVSKKYYEALIDNERDNISALRNEQSELIAARDQAVASGKIKAGSQAWYDMCAEIDSVTQAIEEGETAIIEYGNSIRDIDWQVFDLVQEQISDITAEADFLIELMSNEKLFDDNGKLTDKGMATMGLHGQNYNTYMYAADEYAKQVAELDKQIQKDPYDQELINRRRELIGLQRDSILAAEDEKQAIKDLVSEGIEKELDALQERIDLHNEELDSMKDLYDYQKNVEEQTKNIASLQKQLHAYDGFNDEETRATVQKLKVELESAQQDLQETEYDKYISDQSALLNELFLEYENILNTRLDDINALIAQVIDAVNIASGAEGTIATALSAEGAIAKELVANGVTIKNTLETEAKGVGATLSTAMNNIWSVGEGNAKSVLEMYGKGFQDKQTTTNAVLGDIKTYIGRMVDDVDKDANQKVTSNKTTTSAKKDPTKTTTATKSTTTKQSSSVGDGIAKVGDKVKFLSGKYYYDSQGVTPAGSKNQGKQVYITKINTEKWATHPYHISTSKTLGHGDLGWLKLSQITGYASGKKNILNNEIAWTQENGQEYIVRPSDGAILTPIAKGDSVLNAQASSNIFDMANSPADFIKDNLNFGATNVPNNSNVQSNYTQYLDKVVFNLPNVQNYNELLSEMQKDKNFERLILSMTVNQIAGKSSLSKGKSIR